jgi:ribonuclease HI
MTGPAALLDAVVYTDGGCIGNPGPGGYGVMLISGKQRSELSGGYRQTTNNRMELMAAVVGLGSLKTRSRVSLYSDSRYLVDGINKGWARQWRARGWRKAGRGKALNTDLWLRLLDLCDRHEVTFTWVEGHAGNRENERCDQLSMQAARGRGLPVDPGYEVGQGTTLSLFPMD